MHCRRILQGTRGRGRLGAGSWNGGGGRGRESWSRRGGRGRGGQSTGMHSNNRGVRGALEAGHKRNYASALLGSPGEAHLNHAPHAPALNLLGLGGGGVVQGGAALGPLLNQVNSGRAAWSSAVRHPCGGHMMLLHVQQTGAGGPYAISQSVLWGQPK